MQEEIIAVRYLSPDEIRVHTEDNRLFLDLDGTTHEDVRFRCAFPLNAPRQYVAVKDSDSVELGIIKDLANVEKSQRKIILAALRDEYFIPAITGVESVQDQFGVSVWEVQTDRGRCTFRLRGRHQNITETPDGRVLITDVDSNRYEVKDRQALDPKSRRLLSRLI